MVRSRSNKYREYVSKMAVAVVGLLCLGLYAGQSMAGDIAAQPASQLNLAGGTGSLLGDGGGATETGWLESLHVTGYGSQIFGMWQNPTALRQYTPSRNNLSTARSTLQVDENYRLNEDNSFFMREWFVYEPPYSFNSANNTAYAASTPFHSSFGSRMNGFYNDYDVRDAWWQNKTGPLDTFVGNQIVVWGQSLAFRVGDVVNPTDTCWAFGFANLEQSRIPQWMIHPVLYLPDAGSLGSNFVEGIWQPGFQPRWTPEQTNDPYNKYRDSMTAGREQPCLPAASHGPSARFDVGYDTRPFYGGNAPLGLGGPFVSNPASREFMMCSQLAPSVVKGFNYFPAGMIKSCALGLNKHQGNYGPIGDGLAVDTGYWHVPGMQPTNWNEGLRLHTVWGETEMTALYYNDNTSGGGPWSLRWTPYTNLWNYSSYDVQNMGVTADRPMPLPESIAEHFPAVVRAEMLYSNHNNFESNKVNDLEGQRYSDVVKWMAAIDLTNAYAPWLTSTGTLSANFEITDNIVMDNCKLCFVGNDLGTEHQLKNDVNMLLATGTSYWYGDFAPEWAMIFNPKGRSFALFPSITLNPPWTKTYFMKLQAIEVMGGDNEAGVGLFKGQSQLNATFQYNFDVM